MLIDGSVAITNFKKPESEWSTVRRRNRAGIFVPLSNPSFHLNRSDTIFTMGSCFARNIERHLAELGCIVPALDFKIEDPDDPGQTTGMMNVYSPPIFRQEMAWATQIMERDDEVSEEDCEPFCAEIGEDSYRSLGWSGGKPVSKEFIVRRRKKLYELYKKAFEADCVIFTPGVAEAWYDTKFSRYTNCAPITNGDVLEANRFKLAILDHGKCVEELTQAIAIVRQKKPNMRFIVTVSPIPLIYTFSGNDIATANLYSKSVLRSACEEVCRKSGADYFPSYEAAMLSRGRIWERDFRHVSDKFVRKIITELISRYFDRKRAELDTSQRINLSQRILSFLPFKQA